MGPVTTGIPGVIVEPQGHELRLRVMGANDSWTQREANMRAAFHAALAFLYATGQIKRPPVIHNGRKPTARRRRA